MKITLNIEDISEEEAQYLRVLINDAMGEFQRNRGFHNDPEFDRHTVAEYVHKRYPDFSIQIKQRKIEEVMMRCKLAMKVKLCEIVQS